MFLFIPSLHINQEHVICLVLSNNYAIFATFPLKKMSLCSNHVHHGVANKIRWDALLSLFPLHTSLKSKKSSTNSSPHPLQINDSLLQFLQNKLHNIADVHLEWHLFSIVSPKLVICLDLPNVLEKKDLLFCHVILFNALK